MEKGCGHVRSRCVLVKLALWLCVVTEMKNVMVNDEGDMIIII